jgi:hypothetical protein
MEQACTLPQVREETLTEYAKGQHITARGGNKTDYMRNYFKYFLIFVMGRSKVVE